MRFCPDRVIDYNGFQTVTFFLKDKKHFCHVIFLRRFFVLLSVLTVICFSLFLCFPFPPFLSLPSLSLSQSSSAAISPQLTKLHQLAMQQSPFPIAPSNQGFTGMQHMLMLSLRRPVNFSSPKVGIIASPRKIIICSFGSSITFGEK